MTNEDNLNTCRICGGEASNFIAGIYCNKCGAGVSRYGKTNEQVVEAWNKGEIDEYLTTAIYVGDYDFE